MTKLPDNYKPPSCVTEPNAGSDTEEERTRTPKSSTYDGDAYPRNPSDNASAKDLNGDTDSVSAKSKTETSKGEVPSSRGFTDNATQQTAQGSEYPISSANALRLPRDPLRHLRDLRSLRTGFSQRITGVTATNGSVSAVGVFNFDFKNLRGTGSTGVVIGRGGGPGMNQDIRDVNATNGSSAFVGVFGQSVPPNHNRDGDNGGAGAKK